MSRNLSATISVSSSTVKSGSPSVPEPRLPYWESMTDEQILELIPKIAAVSDQVDGSLRERINDLRARGVSWARIGSALGVARQSAWERFSAEERPPAAEG
jgi:hypothetical protein